MGIIGELVLLMWITQSTIQATIVYRVDEPTLYTDNGTQYNIIIVNIKIE